MKWVSAIALAGVCLVSACNQKAGNAAPGAQAQGPGGAAAANGPDVAITMADLPHPRGGLWQQTIDDGDGHPESTTSCLSGQAPNLGKMPKDCAQLSIKRTITGAYVIDMSCSNAQFTMVGHTVATGDMQTQMVSDTEMTTTMAGQPPRVMKMHNEAHYVGACAPGQKPDDLPDTPTGATSGATN